MSTTTPTTREAMILGTPTIDRVAAYLPSNYTVEVRPAVYDEGDKLWITGHDNAGWTLDGYVLPRLASGNIYAVETI